MPGVDVLPRVQYAGRGRQGCGGRRRRDAPGVAGACRCWHALLVQSRDSHRRHRVLCTDDRRQTGGGAAQDLLRLLPCDGPVRVRQGARDLWRRGRRNGAPGGGEARDRQGAALGGGPDGAWAPAAGRRVSVLRARTRRARAHAPQRPHGCFSQCRSRPWLLQVRASSLRWPSP